MDDFSKLEFADKKPDFIIKLDQKYIIKIFAEVEFLTCTQEEIDDPGLLQEKEIIIKKLAFGKLKDLI